MRILLFCKRSPSTDTTLSKTVRSCSRSCTSLGVTTQRRFSHFACSHKRTNMHRTFYTSCESTGCWLFWYQSEIDTSADLEVTVAFLVQIDKLVQLIESPVFTCELHRKVLRNLSLTWDAWNPPVDLRLQLLEPEKYPYLFKCLYGLLMLLPQSSAFVSLRNRLNAVNSSGFLHIAPKPSYDPLF